MTYHLRSSSLAVPQTSLDMAVDAAAASEAETSPVAAPMTATWGNRNVEISVDNDDEEMRTALLAWLSRSQADQVRQEGQFSSLTPRTFQDHEARDVEITVQFGTPQRKHTSRYLCERDRREIIKRVSNGEQQATLAKEFNVSRATVCNLYKNRSRVLNRAVIDLTATHPKKPHNRNTQPRGVTADIARTSVVLPASTSSDMPSVLNDTENGTQDVGMETLYSRMRPRKNLSDQDQSQQQERQCRGGQEQSSHHNKCQGQAALLVKSRPFIVHEAAAHSYPCRNLVETLRDEGISTATFQQRATRLARLLIEETLAYLPYYNEDVTNQYGDICSVTKTLDERDICGVSMEGRDSLLLQAFSDIIRTSPAGIVSVDTRDSESSPRVSAHLPTICQGQVVILLDIQCATGKEACAVLHHLVDERKISADQVYFVTLISSFEGLQKVSRNFPGVTLVTAQMDTVLDDQQRIRPGIGNLMQRFWEAKTRPFT